MLGGIAIGLAFGLLGAALIGTSDVIARVTAQRVALPVLLLFVFGLSTPLIGAWLFMVAGGLAWDPRAWAVCVASGVLNVAALAFLYLALARGPVSLASPAASSFTVMLVLMNIVAGEPYGASQVVAVLLVFFGIAMLSRAPKRPADGAPTETAAVTESVAHLRGTLLLALLAAATVSLRFFLAQEATEQLGVLETIFLTRAASLVTTLLLLLAPFSWSNILPTTAGSRTSSNIWRERGLLPLVLIQATFETAALAAFLAGGAMGDRIAVTIGFSAFAAISPIVAWLWLKDELGGRRLFWIGVVVIGAALSALPSP